MLLLRDPLLERLAGGLLVGRVAEPLPGGPVLARGVAAVQLVVDVALRVLEGVLGGQLVLVVDAVVAVVWLTAKSGTHGDRYPGDRLTLVRDSYLLCPVTTVLGVDSSTQSTKALLVDAADGTVLAQQGAPHPPGTEVDPRAWLQAYDAAAGPLLPRAAALGVAGQQHGMVARDAAGEPVRDALLWNDTRSAAAAADLVAEHGGPQACADAVGSVLVASFTATKLRWLRDHEPEAAARVADVLLPHDYVSLHACAPGTSPFTDRGDASGTGYFSTATGEWRPDLAAAALGHEVALPRIVGRRRGRR